MKHILISLLVAFALFLFLIFRISWQPGGHNDISRLAGIIAVARYDELNIDRTIQVPFTVDKVQYEGRFYSSKPPVLNFLLGKIVKYVFQIKPVLLDNDVAIYRVSTMLSVVFPLVGIFILFTFLISNSWGSINIYKWLVALFLVLGTLLFSYSRHLNNHILEAFLQLILLILVFFRPKFIKNDKLFFLILGFILSLIVAIDLTYAVVCIPITILFILFRFRSSVSKVNITLLLLGAVPFSFAHFYLNYIQFGILLPPQLFPETYLSYFGSNWVGEKTGMEAQNHPLIVRLFNYTFGTYGLFLYQPILLIPFVIRKNWKNQVSTYILLVSISYIIFNIIISPNYGGSAFGPRRFLPLIPMLFYLVVFHIYTVWNRGIGYKFVLILLLLGTFGVSTLGYLNTWENWNYFRNTGIERDLYFPLLYTIRKVFGVSII